MTLQGDERALPDAALLRSAAVRATIVPTNHPVRVAQTAQRVEKGRRGCEG